MKRPSETFLETTGKMLQLSFPTNLKAILENSYIMSKLQFVFLIVVLLTSGCMDSQEQRPEEVENADRAVMVGEMYFNQVGLDEENTVEADVGDTIVFYNEGAARHTVTIPALGVDEVIEPGDTVEVEVDQEMDESPLNCTFHSNHEGIISAEA